MEKEENHKLPFLDVLLDNHSNQGIITSVFHKKTYTGLLTNYYSFVPFSYKLELVRTLVDRVFKINNTWTGFHLDISNLTKTLRKNLFPSSVIENVVRKFLNNYFTSDSSQSVARKDNCLYFKLPYIGPFSIITKRRIKKLVNTFCSDLEIKLVFTPFKIRSWFGAKDPIPAGLRSRVIYKFSIDTSPLASVNISPPTNIPTYLSTWEVLKIVAPGVQKTVLKSSTLLPHVSN